MQVLRIEKQVNKFKTSSNIYIAALGITVTVCSFFSFMIIFDLPCPFVPVIVLSALFPAALLYLLNSRAWRYGNLFLPILTALYFAAAYREIWNGYLNVANSVITKINRFHHYGYLTYDAGSASDAGLYTMMALIPVIMIFAYFVVMSIKRGLFIPVILLTLPFILTGFYFHVSAALPLSALTAAVWVLLLSGSPNEKAVSWKAAAWIFAVTVLFGGLVCFFIPFDRYTPSQKADSIKLDLVNGVDHLRYRYGIKNTQMDQLPEGNLNNAKTLAFTDEVVMKVKMQKPYAIYLKGFIGSVYSGNRWNSLPATVYGGDYTGLFEWLAKDGFYSECQLSSLCAANPQLKTSGISVNNIALESKYIYTPYEAAAARDLNPRNVNYGKGSATTSNGLVGTRNYSFSIYSPISADYGTADIDKWIKNNIGSSGQYTQYIKDEKAYRAFVYQNYLDVPAKTEKTLENYFSAKTIDSLKNKSYQSVIDFLRRYYLQKFKYSSEIKNLPEGSDFIEQFLKTGSGYDVHFATLSVMLLRSAGIPARYAEGYYLPHNYVDIYANTDNATLDVKDSFAHAWAEIYADGVGWIPAELTPGYYNADKDSSNKTGNDENISKKDKNFYHDQENALTNDAPEKQSKPKNTGLNQIFVKAAVFMFVFAVSVTAVIAALKAKRKKDFKKLDKAKAALKLYAFTEKLIRIDGIKIDRHSAYDSSDEISEKYDPMTGMRYRRFLDLVYKARFGPSEPDAQEIADMHGYTKSLAKHIYVKQGLGKKLILRISGMI